MKLRHIIGLFLLLGTLTLSAQTITQIEYFIDNDPGFGSAEQVSGYSGGSDVTAEFNVPLSILDNGVHTIYVRAKDSDNNWSLLQSRTFIKGVATGGTGNLPNIVSVEYFIDEDLGFGNNTEVLNQSGTDLEIPFIADLTTIDNGVHTIYVRAQDSNGNWSLLQSRTFIKGVAVGSSGNLAEIDRVEYFIDNDTGFGTGTSVSFNPNTDLTDVIAPFVVDLTDEPNGVHTLYVRARDTNGNWSLLQSRTFIKGVATGGTGQKPDITYVEYFIDEDMGFGAGESVAFMDNPNGTDVFAEFTADLADLDNGVHTIYVRAQDANDNWSLLQSRTFIKMSGISSGNELPEITLIEFQIPNTTNYQDWTAVTNFTPSADVCASFVVVEVCDLPNGIYTILTRAQDENGVWSLTASKDFEITDNYLVSGTIVDQNGIPISNAELDLGDLGLIYTNANGYFEVEIPKCWSGDIQVSKTGFVFSSPEETFSGIVGDVSNLLIVGNSEAGVTNLPTLVLDNSVLDATNSINIAGGNYFPNAPITLFITGPNDIIEIEIMSDANGEIAYSIVHGNSWIAGDYDVFAWDNNSNLASPSQVFMVPDLEIESNLTIISPLGEDRLIESENFEIKWSDFITTTNAHPQSFGEHREAAYNIYYSIDEGVSWMFLETFVASVMPNVFEVFSLTTSIPEQGSIRFRVENTNNTTFEAYSECLYYQENLYEDFLVKCLWDKSYAIPSSKAEPAGVAADGVGRIILQIDPPNNVDVDNVYVSLEDVDGGADNPNLLGKLMVTQSDINTYNDEANAASLTYILDSEVGKDVYNFWYVAPDDFSNSSSYFYHNKTVRFVNANFLISLSNGTQIERTKTIQVVRPPLMMVHGLGGSSDSWNDFVHTRSIPGSGSNIVNFIEDERFLVRYTPDMSPNASFESNADLLLKNVQKDNPQNNGNGLIGGSIPHTIHLIRDKGYACNQVYYVCHSMGGCMLRMAETLPAYIANSDNLYNYNNYGKGFVNRLIDLQTPHNGSEWADLLENLSSKTNTVATLLQLSAQGYEDVYNLIADTDEEYVAGMMKDLEDMIEDPESFLSAFFEFTDKEVLWGFNEVKQFQTTAATKNLRTEGGVYFPTTTIPNHLIAGDIIPISINEKFDVPPAVEKTFSTINSSVFVTKLLKLHTKIKFWLKRRLPAWAYEDLENVMNDPKASKALKAVKFIHYLFKAIDVVTFLDDSDFVVTVESQLANQDRNVTHVEVFDYVFHHDLFILPNKYVCTKNQDVGNAVFDLLHTPLTSSKFATTVPMNPKALGGKPSGDNDLQKSILTNPFDDLFEGVSTNNDGISILSPSNGTNVDVNESLQLSIFLEDIVGLNEVSIFLQNQTWSFNEFPENIMNIDLQIDGDYVDLQEIEVLAYYEYGDSVAYDSEIVNINIVPNETLLDFNTEPKVTETFVGNVTVPMFTAVYETFISNIGHNNNNIDVSIANNNILEYSTTSNRFLAIGEGETHAILNYGGKQDTIYFFIYPCQTPKVWYLDIDGDGLGDESIDTLSCLQPEGYVAIPSTIETTQCTQSISLNAGWNLISLDLTPENRDISEVFNSLQAGNLLYVTGFNNGAKFYDPNQVLDFLNTLQEVEDGFGYWVYVQNNDVLTVSGSCLENSFRKDLDAGWNLIAYPPDDPSIPTDYFSDLIANDNLLYVTGFENGAKFYDPYQELTFLNTLNSLKNGFGYWVYVQNAVNGKNGEGINSSNVFSFYNGTSNLSTGETISIQTIDGTEVGQLQVLQEGYLMTTPIYGDDPTTKAIEGINANEKLVFAWNGQVLDIDEIFKADLGLTKIDLSFKVEDMPANSSIKVYPNPAQNDITFEFNLTESNDLLLQFFDIKGQLVKEEKIKDLQAGNYRFNYPINELADGIYTYKLISGQQEFSGKFEVIK